MNLLQRYLFFKSLMKNKVCLGDFKLSFLTMVPQVWHSLLKFLQIKNMTAKPFKNLFV